MNLFKFQREKQGYSHSLLFKMQAKDEFSML